MAKTYSEDLASNLSKLSMRESHKLVVGVDYGTTYSGISYLDTASFARGVKDVHDLRTYPGSGGSDNVWKTPSRIAYGTENVGFHGVKFGFEVTPKMKSYNWTKLLLDKRARLTEFDDPSLSNVEGTGLLSVPDSMSPTEVVSDYLERLYQTFMDYVVRRISREVVNVTPMEFWFTVPAIWSDQAKDATRTAAMAAGFGSRNIDKLFMIPEPEAAGVATLKTIAEGAAVVTASPGDGILICDCGGGTVDITSYRLVALDPVLEFEELVEGIGGKCGSTYIDRELITWMSRMFGSKFDSLPFEKIGPGSRFMREFQSQKHDFGYTDERNKQYETTLVMSRAGDGEFYDSDESTVKFYTRHMKSFFDPVITKIIALLEDQMQRITSASSGTTISKLFLVGGFGDSPYLNERLREWCRPRAIQLACPEHPQAAIARGAALRGLDSVAAVRRKCRRHYGVGVSASFREGIDPEANAWYDEWYGDKMCKKRVSWVIVKGQPINEKTTMLKDFYDILHDKETSFYLELYSTAIEAPPDYSYSNDVDYVGRIQCTIAREQIKTCKSKRINGKKKYKLVYDVEALMGTKEGTLAFRAECMGRELGRTEIEYDWGNDVVGPRVATSARRALRRSRWSIPEASESQHSSV